MNRIESFKLLIDNTAETFIGFGNPAARILIIGKECAAKECKGKMKSNLGEKSKSCLGEKCICYNNCDKEIRDNWLFTVHKNKEHWLKYFDDNCPEPERCIYPKPQDCRKDIFSPRFAFKGQLNIWDKGRCIGGTSLTWKRYQKLADAYYGRGPGLGFGEELTFQDDCFITELSAEPKHKSDYSKETRESIQRRVDHFFNNDFFKGFDVVIAACKGYINLIDLESLFPESKIIVTNQLSRMHRKGYIKEIVDGMKKNERFIII